VNVTTGAGAAGFGASAAGGAADDADCGALSFAAEALAASTGGDVADGVWAPHAARTVNNAMRASAMD
jgi:hypothetical protein